MNGKIVKAHSLMAYRTTVYTGKTITDLIFTSNMSKTMPSIHGNLKQEPYRVLCFSLRKQ